MVAILALSLVVIALADIKGHFIAISLPPLPVLLMAVVVEEDASDAAAGVFLEDDPGGAAAGVEVGRRVLRQ